MSEKKGLHPVLSFILMLFFLWLFLLSIKMFGGTFKHFFKGDSKDLIVNATGNPLVSLLIGILATAIIQSSSSTTSIIVAFVGAGTLSVTAAVPMIMGANIGTSVTNIIVSFGNIRNKLEFNRSFGAAVVHDFFNWLAVFVFLPVEIMTGFIEKSATFISKLIMGTEGVKFDSPINRIVKPIAKEVELFVANLLNNPITESIKDGKSKLHIEYDIWLLIVMVILSLTVLFIALKYMSQIMKSLLLGRFEKILHKYVFNNPMIAMLFGVIFTISVQSSSITTSMVVPLAGAGILSLEQIFPYTIGANIGTTITGILASLVTGSVGGITIAIVHTLFNVMAAIVFYPLKSIPIGAARWFANFASEKRTYAIGFVLVVFFVIPLLLIWLFG